MCVQGVLRYQDPQMIELGNYTLHCVRSELVTNTIDQTYRVASLMFDVLDRKSSLLSSLALHKRCSPDISGVKKALYLSPKLSLLHSKQMQQQTSTFVYIAYNTYTVHNNISKKGNTLQMFYVCKYVQCHVDNLQILVRTYVCMQQ